MLFLNRALAKAFPHARDSFELYGPSVVDGIARDLLQQNQQTSLNSAIHATLLALLHDIAEKILWQGQEHFQETVFPLLSTSDLARKVISGASTFNDFFDYVRQATDAVSRFYPVSPARLVSLRTILDDSKHVLAFFNQEGLFYRLECTSHLCKLIAELRQVNNETIFAGVKRTLEKLGSVDAPSFDEHLRRPVFQLSLQQEFYPTQEGIDRGEDQR